MSAAHELQPAPVQRPDGTVVLRGRAALADLLTVIGGPLVKQPNGWTACMSAVHGPGSSMSWGTRGGATSPEGVVEGVLATRGKGDTVTIHTLLTHEAPTSEPGRTVERQAFGCVVLRMELAEFFAPGGPLAVELGAGRAPGSRSPELSAARWGRARAFAMEHLRNACFPPTRIVDRGWTLDLVYVLRPAYLHVEQARHDVFRVGEALCQFLHAARPLEPGHAIDATGLLDEGDRPRCTLLRLNRRSVWNTVSVFEDATRLRDALAAANPPLRPGPSTPPPPAMGLRTLPPTWDLGDFALEPYERQLLASDGPYLVPDPNVLRDLVVALARRGHGWLDVEALAGDPRFRLHALLGMQSASLRRFKQDFRAALGERDPRYPVRLPYGIIALARIADPEPGERVRYMLTIRDGGRLHVVVLDWDTLTSTSATARAIGRVLQRMPALVSAKVWRAVLDQALIDTRVTRTAQQTSGPGALPLTAHIRDFLAKAQDVLFAQPPTSRRDPTGWPVLRDGLVVFPRAILQGYLAAAGVPSRPKELTLAIESLGGGPRGIMHFRGMGKIRVWFAPILSRT